jgi:hypothetical protein
MNEILEAINLTKELWIFLGILGIACLVEDGVKAYSKKQMVDNPTLW